MKKIALACLIVLAATLTLVPLSEARHHGHRSAFHSRVVIGFGPAYYWGPHPYWYYPPPPYAVYAPPPYAVYAPPPVVVQETPPVYVQQTPPPPPPAASEQFWYYCQSANGYYPAVPSCAEAWVKVAPRP